MATAENKRVRKRRKKRQLWIGLSVIILLILSFIFYVSAHREEGTPVTVEPVQRRTIIQTVTVTGTIKPETEVKISSETSGEIIFLGVEEGDTVRKGQLLVRIKPDIVETQVEQLRAAAEAAKSDIEVAKAELENAKAMLDRTLQLYKKEFASQEELDQAKARFQQAQARYQASLKQYERARASLKQAELSLQRTQIYSPIDGVVIALPVEKGEKVVGTAQMQGTEIMRIADLHTINAEVEVDENDVVLIEPGDTAFVELDALPNQKFRGVVLHVGNAPISQGPGGSNEDLVLFKVEIRLLETDPRMRPGMTCTAEIQTEKKENVLAVPLQAVTVRRSQRPMWQGKKGGPGNKKPQQQHPPTVVFVNDNGYAKMVRVVTGISDGNYIEIVEGLEEGTEVVTGSFTAIARRLKDGSKLIIQNKSGRKSRKRWQQAKRNERKSEQ